MFGSFSVFRRDFLLRVCDISASQTENLAAGFVAKIDEKGIVSPSLGSSRPAPLPRLLPKSREGVGSVGNWFKPTGQDLRDADGARSRVGSGQE